MKTHISTWKSKSLSKIIESLCINAGVMNGIASSLNI